ncbi:hypothetical protein Hanom_Chr13g01238091 [Helianthus anomalus]
MRTWCKSMFSEPDRTSNRSSYRFNGPTGRVSGSMHFRPDTMIRTCKTSGSRSGSENTSANLPFC